MLSISLSRFHSLYMFHFTWVFKIFCQMLLVGGNNHLSQSHTVPGHFESNYRAEEGGKLENLDLIVSWVLQTKLARLVPALWGWGGGSSSSLLRSLASNICVSANVISLWWPFSPLWAGWWRSLSGLQHHVQKHGQNSLQLRKSMQRFISTRGNSCDFCPPYHKYHKAAWCHLPPSLQEGLLHYRPTIYCSSKN